MNGEIKNPETAKPEKKFKSWCKKFLLAFSISAIIYITWKVWEFFRASECGILSKCTIATFSLTGIISLIIYAIAEVIRQ